MMTMVERAEVNQALRVNSRVVEPHEIARLCPELDLSNRVTYPIQGGLYPPPGAVIRHDAVVWAYARAADRLGVDIFPATEVMGIDVAGGRVTGVRTNSGAISAPTVLAAVAGWSTQVCAMAGVELPIVTHNLQAYVTEPIKPMLHIILVSATLHVYVSQTDRGEMLIGSEIEPYSTFSFASTLNFLETSARPATRRMRAPYCSAPTWTRSRAEAGMTEPWEWSPPFMSCWLSSRPAPTSLLTSRRSTSRMRRAPWSGCWAARRSPAP